MAKKLDLTKHSREDLLKLANDKREELRALRFNVAGSKNSDVKLAGKLRKDIARALTQLTKLA
jgi:ribosomal protein L29